MVNEHPIPAALQRLLQLSSEPATFEDFALIRRWIDRLLDRKGIHGIDAGDLIQVCLENAVLKPKRKAYWAQVRHLKACFRRAMLNGAQDELRKLTRKHHARLAQGYVSEHWIYGSQSAPSIDIRSITNTVLAHFKSAGIKDFETLKALLTVAMHEVHGDSLKATEDKYGISAKDRAAALGRLKRLGRKFAQSHEGELLDKERNEWQLELPSLPLPVYEDPLYRSAPKTDFEPKDDEEDESK
jgi:hypothetical protein